MSDENNSDEITTEVISEDVSETNNLSKKSKYNDNIEKTSEDLSKLLDLEKQKSSQFEEKLKHVLADFQNLSRKTQSDIEHGVNSKINEFMLDFIKIYDDFIRSKYKLKGIDSIKTDIAKELIKLFTKKTQIIENQLNKKITLLTVIC